jgi:hypothetical protein
MAADQLNYDLFTYVDDNAVSWNKRGESNSIINTVDGSSAFGTHPAWGRESARHRTRKIIYRDGSTFRTKSVIFYTASAYNAIALGTDTLALHVPGETATVDYTAYKKVPEHSPAVGASRKLADHA